MMKDKGYMFETVHLDGNAPLPPQLRKYRKRARLSVAGLIDRIGGGNRSAIINIYSFEKMEGSYQTSKLNLSETAIKYCRALGAKRIIINL